MDLPSAITKNITDALTRLNIKTSAASRGFSKHTWRPWISIYMGPQPTSCIVFRHLPVFLGVPHFPDEQKQCVNYLRSHVENSKYAIESSNGDQLVCWPRNSSIRRRDGQGNFCPWQCCHLAGYIPISGTFKLSLGHGDICLIFKDLLYILNELMLLLQMATTLVHFINCLMIFTT